MRVQGWKAVQREIWAWATKNFGARVPGRWRREPDARGVSEMTVFGLLVEETGEVMRCVVKREQGIRGSAEDWTRELRKELGDVGIALMQCASYEGWDLEELISERWATVSQRDWVNHPNRGHAAVDTLPRDETVLLDCLCRDHGQDRCCPVHPVHVWPHRDCARYPLGINQ